jgi:hypothetical protein
VSVDAVFDVALERVLRTMDADPEGIALPDDLALQVAIGELTLEQARILADARMPLSAQERAVMAHATAWDQPNRLYRNHFCAGPGHAYWDVLTALCERGLMRVGRKPSPISGGDTVFMATPFGIAALLRSEVSR